MARLCVSEAVKQPKTTHYSEPNSNECSGFSTYLIQFFGKLINVTNITLFSVAKY